MRNNGVAQFLRNEICLENRKLHHHDATEFCKSQWQIKSGEGRADWGSRAYLVYRLAVPLFVFFGGILYDFIDDLDDRKCKTSELHCKTIWPIFLTNWNTFLLFLQTSLAAFLVTRHQYFPSQSGKKMQAVHKVYWVLNNMSSGLSPIVTIMYWGFVHNPKVHFVDYVNVREHAIFTAIVLIDLLICAHPMRLMHLYQPLALGLTYIAFSAVYSVFDGINRLGQPFIYDILDWSNNPDMAAVVGIGTNVFECVIYFFVWSIHLLRKSVASKYFGQDSLQNSEKDAHEFGEV